MPDFQIKVEALTKDATDKFKELSDTAEDATKDRKIKVTAELKPANQVFDELNKSADEATRERKIKIDTSAIEKSINSLKSINLKEINDGFDDLKVAGERVGKTVQMVYKGLKTYESATPGFGPIQASEDLAKATLKAARATPQVTAALIEGSKAGNILSASFNVAANSAVTLVDNMARIGFSLFAVKQTIGVLQGAFKGLFDETIGREIQFRETILKTQTTMASTSRVFRNGKEITQPYEKIVALTGAIEERIKSIEDRSVDLAGVTSNEVVEVFNVVSSQIGRIGGDLKDAEDLAISFASALGTFGIPLYQARQEITSMMMGQVTSDSYLATALNIKSADIAKAKTQTGGVIKFIQDKLEAAVAGQAIAARGFSGITSNIRDLQEIWSKSFGAGMLDPLLTGLTRVYKFLSSIKTTVKDIAKYSGEAVGKLVSTNLNLIFGGSDLFKGFGPSTEKLSATILSSIGKVTQSVQADVNHLISPLKTIFEEVAKSILLITSGLATLAKGFVDMKFNQFAALLTIIESLIPAITALSAGVGELLKLYGNLLQTPVVSTFARIRAELELLDKLGLTNITQFVFVGAMLIRAWQPVGVFFKNLAVQIAGILSEILSKVAVVVTKIATLVKSLIATLSDASSGVADALSQGLDVTPSQEVASTPQGGASGGGAAQPAPVENAVTKSLEGNLVDPQVKRFADSMREIKHSFLNTAGPAVDKLKGKVIDLGNAFISAAPQSNKFRTTLENLGSSATKTGASLFSRIKEKIRPTQNPTDVAGAVRDSVQTTFVNPTVTRVTDSLKESVNKAAPAVGGLRSKIKELASGFTTAIPGSQGFIDSIKKVTSTTIESQSILSKLKDTVRSIQTKPQTVEQSVQVTTDFTTVPRLSSEQRAAAEKQLSTPPPADTQLAIPGLEGMANSAEMLSKVKSAAEDTQMSLRRGLVDVLGSVSTGLNKVATDAANTARTLSSFKLIAAAAGQAAGKAMSTVLTGFVKMVQANIYLMAINFALTRLIILIGAFNRKNEEIARSKRANQALEELKTKYKDVGESADEATKVQKAYLESLVSAEYDAAADKLNKFTEIYNKMQEKNIFQRSFDGLKALLAELGKLGKFLMGDIFAPLTPDFWTLDGKERAKKRQQAGRAKQDTKIFGFDTRNLTDIWGRHSKDGWYAQEALAGKNRAAADLERLGYIKKDKENKNNDNITTEANPVSQTEQLKKRQELEREMAERRRAFEEDLFDFRKQQEDVVFERRQALAQKEIDIFRATGELRIAQMEKANAKALEGEEGASRAGLEALNTYLTEREKGELDIEAQKKEVSLEVVKVERALSDYRLSQERRIAEIRRAADKFSLDAAKARAEFEAMSAANSVGASGSGGSDSSAIGAGSGAFDTGLRTGPSGVIGGSADYHQDMAFGDGVGIKQQLALVKQMAEAYDKIGRKMELSNKGVAGDVFPLKGTEQEQIKWITSARAAHRARNGGTGRDAIDFYTPTKDQTRSGSSVVNTPMLAPTIPGAKKEYFSGGAAGAGIRLVVDGKNVFGLMHGRTDIPLPKNGVIPSSATPSAPVLPSSPTSSGRANTASSGISPEVRAVLDTIRYAEGTWLGGSEKGYRTMFGGGTFSSYERHPDKVIHGNGYSSAAAGAYQFLPNTWNSLKLNDFSPANQDIGATKLLQRRGALSDAASGKLTAQMLNKLAPEWASLPTLSGKSYYGQPVKNLAELQKFHAERLKAHRSGAGGGSASSGGAGSFGSLNLPSLPDFSKIDDPAHLATVANLDKAMLSADEKLRNLKNVLQELNNETNFDNIAKAFEDALPGKESFEDLEDGLYKTKLTIQAVAESVDQAYDPENAALLIEHQGHLNTLQREFGQLVAKVNAKTDLEDKKKVEVIKRLNEASDAYIKRQEQILSYKKQQLAAERALAYVTESAARIKATKQETEDIKTRSKMQFSGMQQEDIDLQMTLAQMDRDFKEKFSQFQDVNPIARAVSSSFADTTFDLSTYTSPITVAPKPTPVAATPVTPVSTTPITPVSTTPVVPAATAPTPSTNSPITVKPVSTATTGKPTTATPAAAPAAATPDAISAITSSLKKNVLDTQAVLTAFASTAESSLGPALVGSVTDLYTASVQSSEAFTGLLDNMTEFSNIYLDATGGMAAIAQKNLVDQKEAEIKKVEALKAAQDPVNNMLGQWRREIADTRGQITSLGSTIQSELSTAMSTSITGVIQGTTTVKEAFGSMFQNIGDSFIKMAMDTLSKAVVGDLMQMLGNMGGGMGGAGGGGGMLGGLFSGLFGGARAAGGNAAYGRPLLVGERGPEIFVPPATGQIIPNHRSQGVLGQMNQAMTAAPEYAPIQKGGIRPQAPDPFSSNRRALDDIAALQRERTIEKTMSAVGGVTEIKYSRVNSGDLPFITEDDAKEMAKQAELNGAKMGQQRTLAALRGNPSTRRQIGI